MKVLKGLRFGPLLNQMTRNTKAHAKEQKQIACSWQVWKVKDILWSYDTKY